MKIFLLPIFLMLSLVVHDDNFLMNRCFDKKTLKYTCYERYQLKQYEGTDVHHLVALPDNYSEKNKMPVLFELTGNKWAYGNGTIEEAHFALSLCLKRDFIVVVVPYISTSGEENQVLWWGDEKLTVSYLKDLIKSISNSYNVDMDNLFLCGFSRGAIGVSYIGLYDDEIASYWKGFISHDHFDGFREWKNTTWGTPYEKYRASAIKRLSRVHGREWYVSYNGIDKQSYQDSLKSMGVENKGQFSYQPINVTFRFPHIPNSYFKSAHNDLWPAFDLPESRNVRSWLYKMLDSSF